MTKRITITMTHPRSGWTRLAGTVLPICETASTEAAMSEFDALQCIAAGQGEWSEEEVAAKDKPQRHR